MLGRVLLTWGLRDVEGLPQRHTQKQLGTTDRFRPQVEVLARAPGVVAVLKPPGVESLDLLDTFRKQLLREGRPSDLSTVSRLDFMTSGVLVVALGDEASAAAHFVRAQFAGRLVSKLYIGLCSGKPLGPPGTQGDVKGALKEVQEIVAGRIERRTVVSALGREARTHYEVLASFALDPAEPAGDGRGMFSLLHLTPISGRKQQLRAHMASLGRPVVADPIYSPQKFLREVEWCPRMFLHCGRVELMSLDGKLFSGTAPLPLDLVAALAELRLLDRRSAGITRNLKLQWRVRTP